MHKEVMRRYALEKLKRLNNVSCHCSFTLIFSLCAKILNDLLTTEFFKLVVASSLILCRPNLLLFVQIKVETAVLKFRQ